jgi:hypothetical protein
MLAQTLEAPMVMHNYVSGGVRGSIEPEGCGDPRANYPASVARGVFGTRGWLDLPPGSIAAPGLIGCADPRMFVRLAVELRVSMLDALRRLFAGRKHDLQAMSNRPCSPWRAICRSS